MFIQFLRAANSISLSANFPLLFSSSSTFFLSFFPPSPGELVSESFPNIMNNEVPFTQIQSRKKGEKGQKKRSWIEGEAITINRVIFAVRFLQRRSKIHGGIFPSSSSSSSSFLFREKWESAFWHIQSSVFFFFFSFSLTHFWNSRREKAADGHDVQKGGKIPLE